MRMDLKVISAVDGTDIARMLKTHLDKFCDTSVISFDDSIPLPAKSVFVLIFTPVMLKEIINKADAIKELLVHSEKLVVFHACQNEELKYAKNLLLTNKKKDVVLNQYDIVDNGQLFIGEAKIKELVSKHQDNILMPKVKKYMIKPERISQGQGSSVLVIMFDECHPKRVTVQSDLPANSTVKISANAIRSGVWSFSAEGLVPGRHTVVVCVDDNNIGTTTLTVLTSMEATTEALATVIQEQPKDFLARVMGIEEVVEGDLDHQLEDIFQSSLRDNSLYPFSKLALGLLQIGEEAGKAHTFPHFLHFCAKYGLSRTCKWILNNVPQDRTACNIRNKDNQTPSMMVKDDAKLTKILEKETTGEDDGEEKMQSPLRRSSDKMHTNSWKHRGSSDSGNGGSNSSVQGNNEPDVRSKSYRFQRKDRIHPYSEIDDLPSGADILLNQKQTYPNTAECADNHRESQNVKQTGYDFDLPDKDGYEPPWDQKSLLARLLPHAKGDQTLPRHAPSGQRQINPESCIKRHNSMDTGPSHIQLKSCDPRSSTKL